MAKKFKYSAVAPNGAVATRGSARVYTHAVFARNNYEYDLNVAQTGDFADASNYDYYREWLDGTSRFLPQPSYRSAEAHAKYVDDHLKIARANIGDCATKAEYVARQKAARIAAVEERKASGGYENYGCVGWCGRPDLAEKLAAQHRAGYWIDAVIVEAVAA